MSINKPNPFSLYDFLGYFTPGAIVVYAVLASKLYLGEGVDSISGFANSLSFDKPQMYIPFVIFSYTLGHVLSYISSITVEKYSIWRFGYPSKYLLGVKQERYFSDPSNRKRLMLCRLFVLVFMFPVFIVEFIIISIGNSHDTFAKRLDPFLVEVITGKINELTKQLTKNIPDKVYDPTSSDYFRMAYHYAVENSPNHFPKMQNYVALFGYLRTLALISIMMFWGVVSYSYKIVFDCGIFVYIIHLLISILVAFFLYMAFMKFYRRFSLEAMMAIATMDIDK